MEVVSQRGRQQQVHFEAPGAGRLGVDMRSFMEWFERGYREMDGLVRAAVAHLYFVTIHPFDDGNGHVARAISDLALAQDDGTACRIYSVSSQILGERDAYYAMLERTQRGI